MCANSVPDGNNNNPTPENNESGVSDWEPLTIFNKNNIIRQGGISLIVQRRDVLLKTKLKKNQVYCLVPSTWKTNVSTPFYLSIFVDSPNCVCKLIAN